MPLHAHSPGPHGRWHTLADHSRGTAELAAAHAAPFGAADTAAAVGMLHDLGKATAAWQAALRAAAGTGGRTGVPHKQHAARFLQRTATAGTIHAALAVAGASACLGHHRGIPDLGPGRTPGTIAATLHDTALDPGVDEAVAGFAGIGIDATVEAAAGALPGWLPVADWLAGDPGAARRVELFIRMMHSALVDADFLDTSAHFRSGRRHRPRTRPGGAVLAGRLAGARAALLAGRPVSPVDVVRERLYTDAVAAATGGPGMYRMTAATGTGKTIAAMAFAAHHAAANGLRRVVWASPFITITEQTADVARSLFGGTGTVLEHHSAVDDAVAAGGGWRRLAAQNWDAPVVVTTTVQLFESLFGNRPGRTRKLHRLAGSVIVLDEVQALPLHLLPAILEMLRTLVEDYGVSVLLASATQPEFWALPVWSGFPVREVTVVPVVPPTPRVGYEWRPAPVGWMGVAGWVAAERSALVVVNTTGAAQALHREVAVAVGPGVPVFHLSTRMCPAHRRVVLRQVRDSLAVGEPVHLVATQVVEVGVDVDFPAVFRASGPLPSVLQVAGRCNREGLLPGPGRVVVFRPRDNRFPDGGYGAAALLTEQLVWRVGASPEDPAVLAGYYRELYRRVFVGGESGVSREVRVAREGLMFQRTADLFRMIDDGTVPVLVEWDDPGLEVDVLAGLLVSGVGLSVEQWQFLQSRSVQVSQSFFDAAVDAGAVRRVAGTDLWRWVAGYDPDRGVELP